MSTAPSAPGSVGVVLTVTTDAPCSLTLPPTQPQPTNRWRWYGRWSLLAVALVLAYFAGREILRVDRNYAALQAQRTFDPVAYTEPIKAAVAQKLESSKGLFQASVLVLALLWGLVIAKKDEHKLLLTDVPEFVMFLLATIWFAASWYCYSEYLDAMAQIHSRDAKYSEPADVVIMDFRSPLINSFFVSQGNLWLYGVVTAALTLFSAHRLKENP